MTETKYNIPSSLIERRFRPLFWDIRSFAERSKAIRSRGIINKRAETTRYSIRALRYWWLYCSLLDELQQRTGGVTVADFGCSFGQFKQFFGDSDSTTWIGFDWDIDEPQLRSLGYSDFRQCDFDQEIPFHSNSVDVAIFSHVVEHLPRPEFTISEIARILRPGGVLLAGSPVVPFPFSRVRDWHHRRRYQNGMIRKGGHINSMDAQRWNRLLKSAGLEREMMQGTFFFRWSGNPLENFSWWIRVNQLWGAAFPTWGGEIYLSARKHAANRVGEGF